MTDLKCQQYEVYAAEGRSPQGRFFGTLLEVSEYLDELINAPWWADRFTGLTCVTVQPHSGSCGIAVWDGDGCGRIGLSKDGLYEQVVLHEVAHLLAAMEVGSSSHDPHWARVYLELVFRVMGPEVWQVLRQAMLDERVELD